MGAVWTALVLVLLVATLVVVLAPRFWRRGPGADALPGTLLVTGVSPRPAVSGQQFVTIAGVINGPTIDEYSVYQQLAVDVGDWPSIGELRPVLYSPRNPDNWRFAPPESPA